MEKIKWKKLFAREYAVQYTEISLRSLSAEACDIIPFTFYEQIYIPDGKNQVCYVDEQKWDRCLEKLDQQYNATNVKNYQSLFINKGKEYVNYSRQVSKKNLKHKKNTELIEIYRKYQYLCVRYSTFIWTIYFINDHIAEQVRKIIMSHTKDPNTHYAAIFKPIKKAGILQLKSKVVGANITESQARSLYKKFKYIPCLEIQNPPWSFREFKSHLSEFKKSSPEQQSYNDVVKELQINQSEKKILKAARIFAYLKDFRDDFRRKGIFYIRSSLFAEIARRLNVNIEEITYLLEAEIIRALKTNRPVDKNVIIGRKKGFVIRYSRKKITCVSGNKINQTLIELGLQSEKKQTELVGAIASKGTATGRVVIVESVLDLPNVRKGDIIIAVTTHPDFVPAMQRASAIVTDEGGITSHAAIVSRELGIPCIVGTKNGTKILKSGDQVQVDANTGIIKILNKA